MITDNTSKSFVSEGRKSNIMPYSKPVSVNVMHKNGEYAQTAGQSVINNSTNGVIFPNRNSIAQKPILEQKPIYNAASVINKGIGLSSSKPISVQNVLPLSAPSNYHTSLQNLPTSAQNLPTSVQNFPTSVQTTNYPPRYP